MPRKKNGFTLIELMVTVAVLAIVTGVAIPSFQAQIKNNRSVALASEFTTALNYARSEAIKRAGRISICPSQNGTSCLGETDWAKGWLVFVDGATSDSAAIDIKTPLKYWGDLNEKLVMTAKKKDGAAIKHARFTSSGLMARDTAADTAVREFEMEIIGCKANSKRKITVGLAGIANVTKLTCSP